MLKYDMFTKLWKKTFFLAFGWKTQIFFLLVFVDISGHSIAYRNEFLPFWPIFTIFTIFVISYQEWAVMGYLTAHSQYKMKMVKLVKIGQKGEILFLYALQWPPISTNVKRKNIYVFYQKANFINSFL